MSELTKICVFCGANLGNQPIYRQVAQDLGNELVQRGIGLVYGGGSVGLMGTIAGTVATRGGHVVGVIPHALKTKEIVTEVYGELITVNTMHVRKAKMAQLADGFIAMPGGFGTLDELFEAITWGQLGIHFKPVGLLNVNHYFTPLLQWVELAMTEGFVRPEYRHLIVTADQPAALIDKMLAYSPPPGLVQWLEMDET